jgi:hypothetical protein
VRLEGVSHAYMFNRTYRLLTVKRHTTRNQSLASGDHSYCQKQERTSCQKPS